MKKSIIVELPDDLLRIIDLEDADAVTLTYGINMIPCGDYETLGDILFDKHRYSDGVYNEFSFIETMVEYITPILKDHGDPYVCNVIFINSHTLILECNTEE